MYLLNKVIQLRQNSHPDHEKPFLEHLEDLRTMISRIVVTLVISMVICFTFQKQLMEVLRRPVEQVWITQLEAKLPQTKEQAPRPVSVDTWEKAKAAERAAEGWTPEQREAFYQALADRGSGLPCEVRRPAARGARPARGEARGVSSTALDGRTGD